MVCLSIRRNLLELLAPTISVHLFFKLHSVNLKKVSDRVLKSAGGESLAAAELANMFKAPTDVGGNLLRA